MQGTRLREHLYTAAVLTLLLLMSLTNGYVAVTIAVLLRPRAFPGHAADRDPLGVRRSGRRDHRRRADAVLNATADQQRLDSPRSRSSSC